ncbi:MAG TPA: hypothetical protein VFS10_05820 [Pyrinomonadaceae bacterium]|nr:hypothetical protein [Pyrinomonadaceae bacterium]
MKCEECLPLLEEFADGEVDRQTGDSMSAHMAACAECAEAFEALRAEQEMYLRYDRELEVSPAMWEAVRERIAVAAPVRREPKRLPLLVRLREQLALAVAALSVRPALASSMALVLVGVAAGVLWLAQTPRPENRDTIAQATPKQNTSTDTGRGEPNTTATPDRDAERHDNGNDVNVEQPAEIRTVIEVASAAPSSATVLRASAAPASSAARRTPGAGGTGELVVISDAHLQRPGDEDPLLAAQPRALLDDDVLAINARLLDPEEKGVARHVEQAQMLLRSFRNARYAEGDTSIAYEKNLSRRLLDENMSLQLEAESAGNKTTKQVLSSLEPFLLDISNLRDEPSREEVRSIKERMQKKEIIASLQVY